MKREIVLVHGWDPNCYNSNCGEQPSEELAWLHRKKLIDLLGKKFDIAYYNLPGFCGKNEPEDKYWNVEDFARDLNKWLLKNKIKPDLILGYSFGGAVALIHKLNRNSNVPIVLVSPAIVRRETTRSVLGKLGRLMGFNTIPGLKEIYQSVFNRYYRLGTPFLRQSYDVIARRDLREELKQVDGDLLLIYGQEDEVTPWKMVEEIANSRKVRHLVIENAGHNVGGTHPETIVEAVDKFLKRI